MNKSRQDDRLNRLPQMAAAGGLVLADGHGLLIRKHGLWDLPKGKLDRQEKPERCALREIAEETGLPPALLSIRAPLCRSSYISYYSFGPVNKTVDWFLLDYAGKLTDPLTPELSEDIDLCQWIPIAGLPEIPPAARPYLAPVWQAIEQSLKPRLSTPNPPIKPG